MMVANYFFGTYRSQNLQYPNGDRVAEAEPHRTANVFISKWRSQYPVDTAAQLKSIVITNDPGISPSLTWWVLGDNNIHLVDISDFDYQIKTVEPISDSYRVIRVPNPETQVRNRFYAGNDVVTVFQLNPSIFDDPVGGANPNPDPFPSAVPFALVLPEQSFVNFAEERLELGYDYGAVGGQSFSTTIIRTADEREQRNVNQSLPLGRWQLGDRNIAESATDQIAEVSYLTKFHSDRRGSYQGFRYKDWADYKAVGEVIGYGNGIKTDFQLLKSYRAGNAVTYRPIQKPVVGTVDILVNGINVINTPNHGWVVDHKLGTVRNNTPLPVGAILSCNFEFDVPVWFETDEIGWSLEGYDDESGDVIYKLSSVFVVEGRIPLSLPYPVSPSPEISEKLDLGIIYETIEKKQFSTQKLSLKSGYTRRENKQEASRLYFDLGGRNYDRDEIDKILGYFYCARGKAGEFLFTNLGKNYRVRFDTDNLNLKFEAAIAGVAIANLSRLTADEALFNLSALKIQVEEEITKLEPIDYTGLAYSFAYLESAPEKRLFNFTFIYPYGLPSFYGGGSSLIDKTPETSNIFKSSPYLMTLNTSTNRFFLDQLNANLAEGGCTFIIDADISQVTGNVNFLYQPTTLYTKIEIVYNPTNQQWTFIDALPGTLILTGTAFDRLLPHSFTFAFTYAPFSVKVYIDGVLVVSGGLTRNLYVSGGFFRGYFGYNDNFKVGAIQYWQKTLSAAQLAIIHIKGKRRPFAATKYLDVGRFRNMAIFSDATYPYGVQRNPTLGAFGDYTSAFESADTGSLPTANGTYLRFDGISNRITYPWYIGTSWFDSRIFTRGFTIALKRRDSSKTETIFEHRYREFGGSYETYYTLRFIGATQLELTTLSYSPANKITKLITYPASLNDQVLEIFIFAANNVIINGNVYPETTTLNSPPSLTTSLNCIVGRSLTGTEHAAIDLYYFDVIILEQLFQGFNSYYTNTGTDLQQRAARYFYQLGFKQSLTNLEPTNPRLLEGSYSI
jgi:uncharacterized protein (TIGR02217 family)